MSDTPVALVTAASRGIGAAISANLRAQGYIVSTLSRSPLPVDANDPGMHVTGSLLDPETLDTFVDRCDEKFGRIDALVINSGHAAKGPLAGLDDRAWMEAFELLFMSVVRLSRRAAPVMARTGGSIVNISTFAAHQPEATFSVSAVIRSALSNYCKLFAAEYGHLNLRMNNVLPGFIDSLPVKQERLERIPAGRYARASELADFVGFLCAPAGAYVNGQDLVFDGGLTAAGAGRTLPTGN